MAGGRRFTVGPRITVQLHDDEFRKLRKLPALKAWFDNEGEEWVDRLNSDLAIAQVKRKQLPTKPGYKHYVNTEATRIRMYIVAFTARGQAHEKAHSKILKLMRTTKHDVVSRAVLDTRVKQRAHRARSHDNPE